MLALALFVASGIVVSEKFPGGGESPAPTFYRDVVPILQQHCQRCHRVGEMAPMSLVTYEEAKPWARQMAKDTRSKRMPPWFADPCCGHFADDPSLTEAQIPRCQPGPRPRRWAILMTPHPRRIGQKDGTSRRLTSF